MENPANLLRRLNPCCARAMEGGSPVPEPEHAEILPGTGCKLLEQGKAI
ncbi:hypothetical protein MJ579_12850 [Klebsiella pneumoniae]|nr:hypothetical protein MJ579_12850 [Klebsiella pneumoniae]